MVILAMLIGFAAIAPIAVQAVPLGETNNDKFETFAVVETQKFLDTLQSPHEYIPSVENPNKLIITLNEIALTCDVTVDGKTYSLGEDFTYMGVCTYMFFDPVFDNPKLGLLYPSGNRAYHFFIDYTYDFSAVQGGLDGTINLRCVRIGDVSYINSLAGTEDFRNVQIKAAVSGGGLAAGILTIQHAGKVSGWPE